MKNSSILYLIVLFLLNFLQITYQQGNSNNKDAVLVNAIKALMKELPKAYNEINSLKNKTSENVTEIIQKGYQKYSESSSVRQLTGVVNSMAGPLFDNIADSVDLPDKYKEDFKNSLKNVLDNDDKSWILTRILYSVSNSSKCKYVCVLGRNIPSRNVSDWIITDVESEFELANNIMVVKETETSNGGAKNETRLKFVDVPKNVSKTDINEILIFFEIVTIQRLSDLAKDNIYPLVLNENVQSKIFIPENRLFIASAIMISEAIQAAAKAWGFIAKTFGTKVKDSLKQIIFSKGFSFFDAGAQVNKANGLEEANFDKYIGMLLETLEVPTDKRKQFTSALEMSKYTDGNTWNSFDIAFNKTSGGRCKYINLMVYRNPDKKQFDLFIADIQTDFQLAPEVFVIQHSKSVLGGAYASDNVIFKEIPASLTLDDIKLLFHFFEMIAFKNIGALLGIDVNYPIVPKSLISNLRRE